MDMHEGCKVNSGLTTPNPLPIRTKQDLSHPGPEGAFDPTLTKADRLQDGTDRTAREPAMLPQGPDQALEQALTWLQEKDDTSRYAGLTFLMALLEKHEQFSDHQVMERCWKAIPLSFMDRLLKSKAGKNKAKEEANRFLESAVGILHVLFVLISPEGDPYLPHLAARVNLLIEALPQSKHNVQAQILDLLNYVLNAKNGPVTLWRSSHWGLMVEYALDHSFGREFLKNTFLIAQFDGFEDIEDRIGQPILQLISKAQDSEQLSFLFDFVNSIMPGVFSSSRLGAQGPYEVRMNHGSTPPWLSPLTNLIHKTILFQPKKSSKSSGVYYPALGPLITALLKKYGYSCSSLLFGPVASNSRLNFVDSVIIELRSVIPSLQESLHKPEYIELSARLAACYDVISNFIGCLINILESDDDNTPFAGTLPILQDPSTLLRLRRDISETMSLTIDHLRERFDASNAGAKGLHLNSQARDPSTSTDAPLNLTLEVPTSMGRDPLTLAEIRALSLWLRDDDNNALRTEAAGLMDLFMYLYQHKHLDHGSLEHTHLQEYTAAIHIALEGILQSLEGVEAFLAESGWDALVANLQLAIESNETADKFEGAAAGRVLIMVIETDCTGPTKNEWMPLVQIAVLASRLATQPKPGYDARPGVDLAIAMGNLALALWDRAPKGVRRRYEGTMSELQRATEEIGSTANSSLAKEMMEDLEDLVSALRSM